MSDTQKKDSVIHVEVVPSARKKGFKRHCARFWWIYLIASIIIAVLVVVLIIFVAVPKIVQKKLNAAQLTIEGITVSDPESEFLTMAINSTIYADDSVHATIEGFTGVMYLEDLPEHEPFASVDFPETKTADVQTVNVTQNLQIANMEALTTFNTWLIANQTVRVTVEGRTNVHVKGLSKAYGATFKKTLDVPGLDGFSGLSVLNATISLESDDNGDNFKGWVNVPNHSIFTLEIGNASFSTDFQDSDVGVTRLDNMVLYPGDNTVWMHADIEQLPVISAVTDRPYCEGADFPFELTGLNVTSSGQNLTYYGNALAQVPQNVDIPIGEYLQNDLNMTISCSE